MGFNKIFGSAPDYQIEGNTHKDYYEFLLSLNINYDALEKESSQYTQAFRDSRMGYLEKGELYIGIARRDSTRPQKIILYVNPIDWSPAASLLRNPRDAEDDQAIASVVLDWDLFLKATKEGTPESWKGSRGVRGDYMNVGGERGALKEYSGEPSFYMSNYRFYPISQMLQVGIINWMW